MSDLDEQVEKLSAAITGLEAQRAALGDAVVDSALAALRLQLSQLDASRGEPAADDERKIVTIIFADVSGFTAMSEKLDPEEVRAFMNGCFESLVPIVRKYEGTIDKFIGDEIMALFGAPVAHEDDPERALRAGLEMIEAIAAFNRKHGTDLGLHIGINTGRVIAGKIGAEGQRDYSVMGDAVNLAARLEDASSRGEIFVGPNTYRRTAAVFDFEKIPPLNLKGKEAPVEVHRLVGLKASPKSTRGIEGLRAALVGRDSELEQMCSALAALRRGRGSIVAIVGEAGLGKSRLIAELRESLPGNVSWAEGRALSYTSGIGYWLARAILYSLLDVAADAPRSKIDEVMQRSLEQESEEKPLEIYPYLARLLEIPMEKTMEERVKFLSSEALQGRILQAFHDYVLNRAKRGPLVLVWEDLHWCDPSSLQVLETLLPLATGVPLLFLCACRPDEKLIVELLTRAHTAYAPNYCRIGLSPLTREESSSLIQRLLKIEQLPEKMRDLILDRAEGNPFFLEELLRSLLDCGVVRLEQGRVIATRELVSVEIPETLEGVLMSRIDRLEADDKRALQNASVIGRVFQERVLTQLYEEKSTAKTRLQRSLDELQRREFVQSREQQASETAELQENEYIFKHAATHHVAYDSLLLAKRKELHELAAEAIEALFPDRLGELSATIGYHFAQAQVGEKAAYYLGLAAERAQATFANTEAIGLYRSAISQIEPILDAKPDLQKTAARFCEGLGDVLKLSGQHLEARAAYDRARAMLPEAERISRSRLHRKSGSSFSIQRHYKQTAQSLDLAEKELGDEAGASTAEWWQERVEIQLERMHLYYWQGMADEIMQLAGQNRAVVEQQATPMQRGKFFQMLALSQLTESRYRPSEECLRLAELAVSESKDSSHLSEATHCRFSLGLVHLFRGNFAEAIEHCAAALRLAERVGDLVAQARCLTYLATAHRRAHHLDETHHFAVRTQELAAKIDMVEYVAMAKANLAWVAWREGKQDDALTSGREALELWHGMEDPYGVDWMALWPLIAIALDQNNPAQAIEHARALFSPNQHPLPPELMVITQKAIAAWQKNAREVARTDLEQAVQVAHKVAQL